MDKGIRVQIPNHPHSLSRWLMLPGGVFAGVDDSILVFKKLEALARKIANVITL